MIAIMASTTTANRLQKRSGRWAVAVTPDGLSIRTVGAVLPEIVSTAVFTWLIHSNLCEVLDLRSSLDSALIGMARSVNIPMPSICSIEPFFWIQAMIRVTTNSPG